MSDREIIIITGNQSDCLNCAKKLTKKLDTLFLEDPKKAHTILGQEFDAVIFDCHKNFDANAFGAITGTIRGGGYLLLLKPESANEKSLFLKRFWLVLADSQHQTINALQSNIVELIPPPRIEHTNICASIDQQNAVDAIIHVVKGHRRRPLVITADRGRGKSASLGIASATLFAAGYKKILVCAPSKKTAAVIFKHALKNNPDCKLDFYSPDELKHKKPQADLVLIDEAAAVPVALLTSFLKHYSRIVFSSTQHGYEGSGRGFTISFKKVLDDFAPEWKKCQLNTPIRWADNDALEAFVFKSLLLNAEPVNAKIISSAVAKDCSILQLDKAALIKDQSQLSELFGLLVSAHYQTKPSDLRHLLDDDKVTIHITQFKNHIVAVALLIKEGGIDPEMATHIFEGTRRLKGHLVAQSLAANVGIESAPCLRGERIIRVAVHPALQQQDFGSTLIHSLVKKSHADYISTSFGATALLLSFWGKLAFTPVYLGMKRDASSGAHSVVMLHAKNEKGAELIYKAKSRFSKHFPHLLAEPFRALETDLVMSLLTTDETIVIDHKEAQAFAKKQRGYENSQLLLWNIVCSKLSKSSPLTMGEQKVLVLKVLQKQAWKDVVIQMDENIRGKKDALLLLRKAISKLLK